MNDNGERKRFSFIHVIDHATRYNVVRCVSGLTSAEGARVLTEYINDYGKSPDFIHIDAGTEFIGHEFNYVLQQNQIVPILG